MTTDQAPRPDADLVVGVVTHRRPETLARLLDALAGQRFPGGMTPSTSVVVVDNSPAEEGRPVVEHASAQGRLAVSYVPLGACNISEGRNRVLDEACGRAPLLALVDDDEVPAPTWLHHLLDAQRRTGADVVTGPVAATCPVEAPAWVRGADFFSVPAGPPGGGWVEEAYTCNVLLRTDLVERLGLRFDEVLGVSGGEDQLFFRQARAAGARLWSEPAALVLDPVANSRLSARYLLRREFRMGGTLGLLDRSRPGWPAGRPLLRVAKAGAWALRGGLTMARAVVTADRTLGVLALMRVLRAAGMVHGLLGRTYQLYAGAPTDMRSSAVALVVQEGPAYQRAGHSRHLQGLLDHLCERGHDVTVVVPGRRVGFLVHRLRAGQPTYRAPGLVTVGRRQFLVAPRAVAAQLAWTAFRHAPRAVQQLADRARTARRSRQQVDHVLGTWLSRGASAWVTRTLAPLRPHTVLFNTVFAVPEPLILPSSVSVRAVISHDVVHERAASFAAAGHQVHPVDFSASDEAGRLAGMDAVLAIQADDARALRRLAPHARVLVSPVVVDVPAVPRDAAAPGRCLFVGSGSLHNVEALEWFLRECWPGVRERCPQAELHVVGTVSARLATVPAGVVVQGEVPDLTEEYRHAQLVVAPLRTGSGLKVKVVEAMCHGVAIVTTSVGAQGLMGLQPAPFLVADTSGEFVAAVLTVLEDDAVRRGLERAALAAAPSFSSARAFAELDALLAGRPAGMPSSRQGELG